jgi:hypothetical protein
LILGKSTDQFRGFAAPYAATPTAIEYSDVQGAA